MYPIPIPIPFPFPSLHFQALPNFPPFNRLNPKIQEEKKKIKSVQPHGPHIKKKKLQKLIRKMEKKKWESAIVKSER